MDLKLRDIRLGGLHWRKTRVDLPGPGGGRLAGTPGANPLEARTCASCLYWAETDPEDFGARACMRLKCGTSIEKDEDQAWLEDSASFVAILYTKAGFGCALWRRRIDEEEDEVGETSSMG